MSFAVHIVVVSNVAKPVPDGVELIVGQPTRDPWSLPWLHQKVMAESLEQFDLFIYSEHDVLIQERNIQAFLRVSREMPENELPGFLLYEKGPTGITHYVGAYGHFHWDPKSVCKRGTDTFAFLTNEHSGCYVLTRKQLRRAIDSGRYLVPPHSGKYDLACTASTAPYTDCGFRKLICISNLDDFLVHHLPDKYTGPDFNLSIQAFQKQLDQLLAIGKNGKRPASLLETETKLPAAMYSKDYYEPLRDEVVGELPSSVHSILSLGCGSGKTERWLAAKGLQVTAAPLDPVIGACAQASGVELINGDFAAVRAQLEGRKFDCLFISNILHLLPNPGEVVNQFAELLAPGGYALTVTPSVTNLKNQFYKLLGKDGFRNLGNFQQSGIQKVTKKQLELWFRSAGCKLESTRWIAMPRFEKFGAHIPLPLRKLLSSEFIAVGKKIQPAGRVC